MHIIHLNLERGWRGGERQVALLARELSREGLEQTIVGRRGCPLVSTLQGMAGARTVAVGGRISALASLLGKRPPSVIHAHSGNTVPLAVLSRRRGDAVVATRRMDRPVTPFWYNRSDRVVAISRPVVEALAASGVNPHRIIRIASGVDLERTPDKGAKSDMRRRLGILDGATLGLTIAALEAEKDPLTLARALGDLPETYHHAWVGDGNLRRCLQEYVSAHGLDGRFHVIGYDPDPDRWFSAADLFVLPSLWEGLGTALLDAFHFGLPVIGTSISGTAELLEEGLTALLFSPGDHKGLGEAIRRILRDPLLATRLTIEGRRKVSEYDIRKTARAYLELYRACIS